MIDISIMLAKDSVAHVLQIPPERITCTKLTGGYADATLVKCSYATHTSIVKIFKQAESAQNEIAWSQLADKLAIGPKVIHSDSENKLFIMEFVAGRSLKPSDAKLPAVLKNIAQKIHALHASKPSFGSSSELLPRIEEKYNNLTCTGKVKELLLVALQEIQHSRKTLQINPPALTPCHNDLNPRNIFLRDTHAITIIDWGDACWGDPFYDLAIFLVLNDIPLELQNFFLQEYDANLLSPDCLKYLAYCKQLVRFEFALNLLAGVQEEQSELFNINDLSQVGHLSYYLNQFARYEDDSFEFMFNMALASLLEFNHTQT